MVSLENVAKIGGWMSMPEMVWLRRTAQSIPRGSCVVEVGSHKGRSAAAIASPHIRLYCVDSWTKPGIYDTFRGNMRARGLRPIVLKMDTIQGADMFADQSVDWLFEDDGHLNFAQSLAKWSPKVRPGGILSGHDFGDFRYPMIANTLNTSGLKYCVVPGTRIWVAEKPR